MHQLVFGKAPYYKGEILTAYSNFSGKRTKFFNSMDYIIAEEPITTEAYVKDLRETFLVHMLTLKDPLSGFSDVVYMMDKNNNEEKFDMLAAEVEGIRVKALNSTGKRKSMFWSMCLATRSLLRRSYGYEKRARLWLCYNSPQIAGVVYLQNLCRSERYKKAEDKRRTKTA